MSSRSPKLHIDRPSLTYLSGEELQKLFQTDGKLKLFGENDGRRSTFNQKMHNCLSLIMDQNVGCRSDMGTFISCSVDAFPRVLECLRGGNRSETFRVEDTAHYDFPCDGDQKTRFELEKLHGCASTGGNVLSCDIHLDNWCECSHNKIWSNLENRCGCSTDTLDAGDCCITAEQACPDPRQEYFNCEEGRCKCSVGYHRLDNDQSKQCVAMCSPATQNNPFNFTDEQLGTSGCGRMETLDGSTPIGTLDDYCCSSTNQCVIDLGKISESHSSELNHNKNQCLTNFGIWYISNTSSCPREGYCGYTDCGPFSLVQHGGGIEDDRWIASCEHDLCAEHKCEEACQSFADSDGGYEMSIENPPECDNEGHTAFCHCWVSHV